MTEDEARDWLLTHYPRKLPILERFVRLLVDGAERQNLIARSTIHSIWARHIVDSAQLVRLGQSEGSWLDIGTGAGLPGIVAAIVSERRTTLCEPRAKRAAWLENVADDLNLCNCSVAMIQVQRMSGSFGTISARAVATLENIFSWSRQLVSRETRYVLPRGRSANAELSEIAASWQGRFHVERSLTDPYSGIVVAEQVHIQ